MASPDIYFMERPFFLNPSEIRAALRALMRGRHPQAEEDEAFSRSLAREDEIFLKTSRHLLWGKVFFQPLESRDVAALAAGISRLNTAFVHELQAFFFYPSVDAETGEALARLGIKVNFFRYQALASDEKKGVAVQQQFFGAEKGTGAVRAGRLDRAEMSDLIDIALSLTACAPLQNP